jgi:protoporphyrinogen oxidase
MNVAVVGAGFAGLAAAHDLVAAGHAVTLYESSPAPGGLAAGFKDTDWDWSLEHFYHHLFTSDADIVALARETGFADRLITRRPITASFYRGQPYALDGPGPVLRFPWIPVVDRVRMGMVIAYLKLFRDWRALENVTVVDWVRRWMGERAFDVVWEPLLIGKFGRFHDTVPMSWLWARLHKRSMRLIYVDGGFQAFADHLAGTLRTSHAVVRLGTPVDSIRRADGGGLAVVAAGQADRYDRVIVTAGPHLLARIAPELPAEYRRDLLQLRYLGAVVAVLALRRQLMDKVYWLSMDKREFPFLACVEHTNFMDRAHYGGDFLVYIGDYLEPEHRYFQMDDASLLNEWYAALPRINPAFDRSWVRRSWVHRSEYAQPVVSLGSSKHIPPLQTPIEGLVLASMSQVHPWDRGTNYAVEIGRAAAAHVVSPRKD